MRRKDRGYTLGTLAVIMVLAASAVLSGSAAAEEKLPGGAEVCDRYVEAAGGREAFDRLENRRVTAVLEMPAQGLSLDMTIYAERPNHVHSIITNEMIGRIEKGITPDGVVWENSIMSGPVVREGAEKETALRDSRFDRLIDWRAGYTSAVCRGKKEIGGRECYEVEMTASDGTAATFYYDVETGMLSMVHAMTRTAMGDIPSDTYIDEHREVDGVMLPWKITIESMGTKKVITNRSIEHNVEMEEGTFDAPDEILQLLGK